MSTVSVETINGTVVVIPIGSTTVSNPILFLEVNGLIQQGCFIVQQSGTSIRYIFPVLTSTGGIDLVCISQVYGTPLPAVDLNINVYVGQ